MSWQEVTGQSPSLFCPPRQHARTMLFSGARGMARLPAGAVHNSIPPSFLCLGLEDGQRDRATGNLIYVSTDTRALWPLAL